MTSKWAKRAWLEVPVITLLLAFSVASTSLPDTQLPDAPNPASNSGVQDVAVVVLDYPGADLSLSPDASFLDEIFRGAKGGVSISDFFNHASEGRVAFRNFKIFGPYHLNETIYCDQEEKLWKLGVQAASAEVNFQKFSRIVFIMPRPVVNSSCDMYGAMAAARAELQCIYTSTPEGKRCLNFAWIGWQEQMKGLSPDDLANFDKEAKSGISPAQIAEDREHTVVLNKYYITKLITHEMLHGWNLMHNNTYTDDFRDAVPAVNQEVQRNEYGDFFPIMSSSGTGNPVGWLTGAHLVRLGWLNPDEWADVESDGTFEIAPLSAGIPGLKVLKIPRKKAGAKDPGDDLWIEYREELNSYEHISFWPKSSVGYLREGLVVHETSKKLSDGETVLLRFNGAENPDSFHSDYRLPGSWSDPYSGLRLELLSQTPEKATIRVTFQH